MYSQGFLSISPISLLPWLYMTFLLNFGMSTMQRLHIRYTRQAEVITKEAPPQVDPARALANCNVP